MPDARWMSVVIYQRQQGASLGDEERPSYGDVDAEPLPAEPADGRIAVRDRLAARLRSIRLRSRPEGALR